MSRTVPVLLWLSTLVLCALGCGSESIVGTPVDTGTGTAPDTSVTADTGAPDTGSPAAPACTPCTADSDCGSSHCMTFPDGSKACVPACLMDLPSCPASNFRCAFEPSVPSTTVCVPVGTGCCIDDDGDGYGEGAGCMGTDCNDASDVSHMGATEICDGLDNDCDGTVDNGFDLMTDIDNCGACGVACAPTMATADCSTGTCTIAGCTAGYGDCNMSATDGCETRTDTLTDCGTCGAACSRSHATATCSTGSCRILSCSAGWDNCDGNDPNGCEEPLNTLSSCGACGVACSFPHATASCAGGLCALTGCAAGWGNCDGNPANGCEAALGSFFRDGDSDGFGAGPALLTCAAPAGYVANNTDCDDADVNVHPGQTAWFTTPRTGGGYDYNCDGTASTQYLGGGRCPLNCTSVRPGLLVNKYAGAAVCGTTTAFIQYCRDRCSSCSCGPEPALSFTVVACR